MLANVYFMPLTAEQADGFFGCASSWKGRYAAPYESVHTGEKEQGILRP